MPEFSNPFSGVVPGPKLSLAELTRALRLNISAEEEAIHLYEAHADATDNRLAETVLRDVAREERVHVGEFQHLLNLLLSDEQVTLDEGAAEVNEMAQSIGKGGAPVAKAPGESGGVPSVGDMKG